MVAEVGKDEPQYVANNGHRLLGGIVNKEQAAVAVTEKAELVV